MAENQVETKTAGEVVVAEGKIFKSDHGMVVRKVLKAGEKIPSHNHKGEEIFFAVMTGKIKVFLNETETHDLKAGDVLKFNGENFISADALEDTSVLISLIKE